MVYNWDHYAATCLEKSKTSHIITSMERGHAMMKLCVADSCLSCSLSTLILILQHIQAPVFDTQLFELFEADEHVSKDHLEFSINMG